MPCTAPVRGKGDLVLPWNDAINNDPCGKGIVATVKGGIDVSTHGLCLPHLAAKLGLKDVGPPYTFAA